VIALDASVIIAHLDADDRHHDRASALLRELAGDELCASRLTLAEVLVGPARVGKLEIATTALRQLGLEGLGLDDDAPEKLATLRVTTPLKLPDCCVLLAAERWGCAIATFDDRLATVARLRGVDVWS
jgi:predicted nucleic acid-binding protein